MTAIAAPYSEQRQQALLKANATRKGRRDLREDLRATDRRESALRLADLIESPPEFLHSMLVFDLLSTLWTARNPGSSRSKKAKTLMRSSGVDSWAEVGRLTVRQRAELATHLRRVAASCRLVVESVERAA